MKPQDNSKQPNKKDNQIEKIIESSTNAIDRVMKKKLSDLKNDLFTLIRVYNYYDTDIKQKMANVIESINELENNFPEGQSIPTQE